MKLGVVGNPRYRDLKAVLEHVAQIAPDKGITLFCEERLAPFWGRQVPLLEQAEGQEQVQRTGRRRVEVKVVRRVVGVEDRPHRDGERVGRLGSSPPAQQRGARDRRRLGDVDLDLVADRHVEGPGQWCGQGRAVRPGGDDDRR